MIIESRAKFRGHRTLGVFGLEHWEWNTWGLDWVFGDASTRDDFHASNGVRGHSCWHFLFFMYRLWKYNECVTADSSWIGIVMKLRIELPTAFKFEFRQIAAM